MIRRAFLLAASLLCGTAFAQASWPEKPIRLIVPFPAGDGLDIQARTIGQRLAERLGQQVIVDNRPGAGTLIGLEAALKAPADGHTMVLVTTTYVINPSLREKVPYDPVKDFTPVIQSTAIPLIVVGSPKFAPNDFREVLSLAKEKPGQLTMGNSGIGTSAHVGMAMLDSMAGITFNHVAYKGIPQAFTDLVSGDLNMLVTSPAQVMGPIREGKIKPLVVTGSQRMSLLPQVGTVAEAGVPGYEVTAWVGYMVPSTTPAPVVQRLNREMAAILNLPEVKERLTNDGSVVVANTPEQFSAHVRTELDKWSRTIRAAGIRAQ